MTNGSFFIEGFDHGDAEYQLKVNTTTDGVDSKVLNTVYRDSVDPNDPDSKSPTDVVQGSPTISMDVSDDISGVDYSYLNVSDPDGNNVENTTGTSLGLSGLDEGEHTVDYKIVDLAGNTNSGSWTFEVDTSYDGDTSPSVTVEGDDDGVVRYEEDTDIDADFDSADTNGGEASCVVGGVTIATQDLDSASSGDDELQCNLDGDDDDYYDETAEVVIKMKDAAGNEESHSYGDVTFDASNPTVSGLEAVNGLSTFNSNFDVEYSAVDSASDVVEYDYYFNDNSGDSTTEDYDDGEFTVDVEGSDLGSGEHTLYVRVKDEADRWSDSATFDFEYYPNRDPEVSLTVPDNVTVTAGESEDFEVTVENTGDFFVEETNVNLESDVLSENKTVSDMEPGDSVTLQYDVDTDEEDLGEYSVDVSTDSPSASQSFDLRVKANEGQQSSIDTRLEEYEQKLEALEANKSELEEDMSEEQSSRLTSNMSEFKNSVEAAREAVDEGRYYEAQSELEGVGSDFSKAKSSYENVREEVRSGQWIKWLLAGFAVVLVGGIGGLFLLDREDVIDVEEYLEMLQEKSGDSDVGLGGIGEKISDLLDREPEPEEFEWDGFKD